MYDVTMHPMDALGTDELTDLILELHCDPKKKGSAAIFHVYNFL